MPPASKSTTLGVPVEVLTTQSTRRVEVFGPSILVMTIWVSALFRANPVVTWYAPIFTKVVGDFHHHKVVEHGHILLLLVGRSEAPETAQAEAPNIVNVHR